MVRIFIPTISEGPASYNKLFALWHQVKGVGRQFLFDFSQCAFLAQNGVAFIGGLIRTIEQRARRGSDLMLPLLEGYGKNHPNSQ